MKSETQIKIQNLMENSSVHTLTKTIIEMGLKKDCVDAYYSALQATEVLKMVMDEALGV